MAMSTLSSTQTAASASAPPPCRRQKMYDVFFSFRGEDTRWGFVSHLYKELNFLQAIKTFIFKDDIDLRKGSPISPELLNAIEQSHLAIVVLSPNYASSTWCLDELTSILQHHTNTILPIFYGVVPSAVRNQTGTFAEAFTKHQQRFGEEAENVKQWRAALREVASLSGWDSKNFENAGVLIDDIVKYVWRKINPTFTLFDSQEKLVGIDFPLEQLRLQLDLEAHDVRFIGITGMGGAGKTTLAKLLFQRISLDFKLCVFLSDVRKRTLVNLQKQVLFPILGDNIKLVFEELMGTEYIRTRLSNKKVLLVLDDVDQSDQLEKLAGNKGWFGMGSRIIITSKNEDLLVKHGAERPYKVEVLEDDKALALFALNAFGKDQPEEDFLELSRRFVCYAKGLPLALKVLGSSVKLEDRSIWESKLQNLGKFPNPKIYDVLKVSFDGLEEVEKIIFLDVACILKEDEKEQVIEILDRLREISSRSVMDILIKKSLFTIEKFHVCRERVTMHDLVREMAREIVKGKSKHPGERTRLWNLEDISNVFMNNTGTEAIEAIVARVEKLEEVPHWNCKALCQMRELRLLEFDNLIVSSCPEFLPHSLRIIRWNHYPSKCLPPGFQPHYLTELAMPNSKLVRLWDGPKNWPNLKYINLSNSGNLMSTPDFTDIPNLEKLYMAGCINLVEVHPSIALLKKLESLILYNCSKLKRIPEFGGEMKLLSYLNLSETAIEQMPSSIEFLDGLNMLVLDDCKSLVGLPSGICKLKCLEELRLSRCPKVDKLPGEMESLDVLNWIGSAINSREPLVHMKNLTYLRLSGSKITNSKSSSSWVEDIGTYVGGLFGIRKGEPQCWRLVLSSLNRLSSLVFLDLSDCDIGEGDIPDDIGCFLSCLVSLWLCGNNFVSLPSSIRHLSNLEHLKLNRCKRLQQLPDLPFARILDVKLNKCSSLERLSDPLSVCKRRSANVDNCMLSCVDCFRLVEKNERNLEMNMFSRIIKVAEGEKFEWRSINMISDLRSQNLINAWPGSKIPKWFDQQSVGDTIDVKMMNSMMGIAFCVAFAGEWEYNSAFYEDSLEIVCSLAVSRYFLFGVGYPVSRNLCVLYFRRKDLDFKEAPIISSHNRKVSFKFNCHGALRTAVKKCGARVMYEEDLKQLRQICNKRTLDDDDGDNHQGRGSSSMHTSCSKRRKQSL